jgi:hypothetical protein
MILTLLEGRIMKKIVSFFSLWIDAYIESGQMRYASKYFRFESY